MSSRMLSIVAVATLGASASALAQSPTDLTFTATGTHCQDVNWSSETIARHPRIAEACQAVVQRDGKYFVVFSGTVTRVARSGREVTVDFKDGERVTLTPASDMKADIAGTVTRVRDLQRGQELTFYVPQDRFVAEFSEGEGFSLPIPIVQWEPQRIAYAAPASKESPAAALPHTGTELGLLALSGLALVAAGASLTAARRRRGVY
jgi:LPXTG-motif cell wall-anchored protein